MHLPVNRVRICANMPTTRSIGYLNDAQGLADEIVQKTTDQAISAWICEGFACRQPVHELDGLIQSIDEQDQEPDHNH